MIHTLEAVDRAGDRSDVEIGPDCTGLPIAQAIVDKPLVDRPAELGYPSPKQRAAFFSRILVSQANILSLPEADGGDADGVEVRDRAEPLEGCDAPDADREPRRCPLGLKHDTP